MRAIRLSPSLKLFFIIAFTLCCCSFPDILLPYSPIQSSFHFSLFLSSFSSTHHRQLLQVNQSSPWFTATSNAFSFTNETKAASSTEPQPQLHDPYSIRRDFGSLSRDDKLRGLRSHHYLPRENHEHTSTDQEDFVPEDKESAEADAHDISDSDHESIDAEESKRRKEYRSTQNKTFDEDISFDDVSTSIPMREWSLDAKVDIYRHPEIMVCRIFGACINETSVRDRVIYIPVESDLVKYLPEIKRICFGQSDDQNMDQQEILKKKKAAREYSIDAGFNFNNVMRVSKDLINGIVGHSNSSFSSVIRAPSFAPLIMPLDIGLFMNDFITAIPAIEIMFAQQQSSRDCIGDMSRCTSVVSKIDPTLVLETYYGQRDGSKSIVEEEFIQFALGSIPSIHRDNFVKAFGVFAPRSSSTSILKESILYKTDEVTAQEKFGACFKSILVISDYKDSESSKSRIKKFFRGGGNIGVGAGHLFNCKNIKISLIDYKESEKSITRLGRAPIVIDNIEFLIDGIYGFVLQRYTSFINRMGQKEDVNVEVSFMQALDTSLAAKIAELQETNVLISTTGTMLAHLVFLDKSSLIIEIQRFLFLSNKVYRNLANFMGTKYAQVIAEPRTTQQFEECIQTHNAKGSETGDLAEKFLQDWSEFRNDWAQKKVGKVSQLRAGKMNLEKLLQKREQLVQMRQWRKKFNYLGRLKNFVKCTRFLHVENKGVNVDLEPVLDILGPFLERSCPQSKSI